MSVAAGISGDQRRLISVFGFRFSVFSGQCSVIAKPAPVGADAPAEPECSAQRELRLPRIAVNTADNAVCICAQDFALIRFFWPRKNAEERGKSHGYVSFQCSVIAKPAPVGARLVPSRGNQWRAGVFGSARASPSEDRSQHLWQCSLQLRTGFRVDPFFGRGKTRKNAENRMGT